MTNETISKRDAKSVLSKIQHIERTWYLAHSFATLETLAGIKENDGAAHFEDLVEKKCPYYYKLLEVMQDRASSEPKATSYESDEDNSLSGLSKEEEAVGSVATKTAASSASKNNNKKRKTSLHMDDSEVQALAGGNKAMEERMRELARHNKAVEDMEKRRFQLEESRLNFLEQNRFKSMSWQGKNEELNYKMNLLARYEQFKKDFNWTDNHIISYCPDMAQVIEARGPMPPCRGSMGVNPSTLSIPLDTRRRSQLDTG
jgi:hypothetical protein